MPVITDFPITVDIGPWMKFSKELFEVLKAENALMAGMTFGEAAAALGYKFVSGVGWVKNISITTEVVTTGATATEALLGASTATATETVTGTIVLTETANGGALAMGLGSMATALGAVCLVGAAGFCLGDVIGDTIDKAFPEFFNGLFSTVSELLTGSETGLAFLFDTQGTCYLPQILQQAVKEYVEEQVSKYPASTGSFSITVKDVLLADGAVGEVIIPYKQLNIGDSISDNYYTSDKNSNAIVTNIICDTPVYAFCRYCYIGSTLLIFIELLSNSPFTIQLSDTTINHQSGTYYGVKYDDNQEQVIYDFDVYRAYLNISNPCTLEVLDEMTIPAVLYPATNSHNSQTLSNIIFPKILKNAKESNGQSSGQSIAPKLEPYELPVRPKITVEKETWIEIPLPEPLPDTSTLPNTIPQVEPEPTPSIEKIPLPVPIIQPTETPTPSPEIDPSVDPSPKPSVTPVPTPPPPDTGETPIPPLPIIPPISSQSAGLLHVYNPTTDEINEFGKWLWTTFSGDLIDTIGKLFNNPMDAVIGLHELYCTPITGDETTIKAGFLDSDVTSRLVTKRYVEINCNAIAIPEYWGNYLDYAPYTKVHCYLPFIGIVELNPNDIIGHGVQVVYKVDTYNGSCIAMIITAKNSSESVKYQFSGNCAVEVPITSGMKSALQSALIGAGTCAIGAVAGGVVAGATVSSGVVGASAAKGASQRGLNSSNSVSHSGSFGSSFGAMGIKKPYFIVERPVQKVVPNYNEKYGYPAHKMVTIGDCSGYLRCRDFEFKSTTATEEEKKLIEDLLQKGVYV